MKTPAHPATPLFPEAGDEPRACTDSSLIAAHGARAMAVTGTVLVSMLCVLALSPHLEERWTWFAMAWAGYAVLSATGCLAARRRQPGGERPILARGDCRLVIALAGALLLAMVPDHRQGPPPPPGVEGLALADAFAAMHDWGVAMLAQALAIGLAPGAFVCLFFAAVICGAEDGTWTGMAMRRLQLSFVQALALFVRAIRSGEATGWRIMTGGRP